MKYTLKAEDLSKKGSFVGQFFKDKREVGAISPSSRMLGKKICSFIDFEKAPVIIELGPGNGVFTKVLLERMSPDAKLYAFETNEVFCDKIRDRISDDRLTLINDSAEKIGEYMKRENIEGVNFIVSSLPYTVFPQKLKDDILNECVDIMNDKGLYLQFQYSLNANKLLKTKFSDVKYAFSLLNLPPAFVYRCILNK